MSNAWDGGKGDKSRVSNFSAYRDHHDEIFKKKDNRIMKHLFLDDIRIPQNATLWGDDPPTNLIVRSNIPAWKWDIVRSYDEFVKYIEENGIPDTVSFDNDLVDFADHRLTNEEVTKMFLMEDWQNFKVKTGAHCAEYLVNLVKEKKCAMPKWYIHTANSAARPIIKQILSGK